MFIIVFFLCVVGKVFVGHGRLFSKDGERTRQREDVLFVPSFFFFLPAVAPSLSLSLSLSLLSCEFGGKT